MIRIVTDTTAYFKNEEESNGISVVPLYIKKGELSLRERIEISDDEFYQELGEGQVFQTSQPSPYDFYNMYKKLLDEGDEIISVHISSKLSGTVNSAYTAKELLKTDQITIVDSGVSSVNLLYKVLRARELANTGASRAEIAKEIQEFGRRVFGFFLPTDIEYLERGGRISHFQERLSQVLKLYFIAHLHKGRIDLYKIVRNRTRAKMDLIEIAYNMSRKHGGVERVDTVFGSNVQEGEEFRKEVESVFGIHVEPYRIGPVLGSHLGPEFFGISFITKKEG